MTAMFNSDLSVVGQTQIPNFLLVFFMFLCCQDVLSADDGRWLAWPISGPFSPEVSALIEDNKKIVFAGVSKVRRLP